MNIKRNIIFSLEGRKYNPQNEMLGIRKTKRYLFINVKCLITD